MRTPRPPGLLVLAVLMLHLLLGREVQRIQEGWVSDGPPPMPPRMQVALVREMQLQEPPAMRAQPPRRSKPRQTPVPLAAPALPASAASAHVPEATPVPPGEPVVQAASAPAEAASVAMAASAPADGEPGPEWPLSTRLSYVLTGNYRGPVSGQAQVEWLRQGRDYQVHLDVGVGPGFAPLISRRMSSQGLLTPEGIAPQRYDEETKVVLSDARRASVFFLGTQVQLASGAREPSQRGAQDSASQFVQLTWLFLTGREPLQAGRTVQFPLVLPRRQYAWQYEVVGEEMLDTPMGPLASWHLRPTRAPAGGDLAAEVWLAPSLQFLPVRLLIRQDADTYIDLMLRSAPLQAAPESTNGIPRRLSQ
ncbi:hypothetical protein J2X20_004569 [Pelomonas saccharophila]|uniref:DUF3108 domain-containing protein n=1 Tax=Roseateles saccharophilus TaxID=304 RepID=A0ABU1YVA2_ROSSA|nr:DUF3108 domain-containing protein [Roseateles saccharophilus]MDR7271901.1 hypothetical protein [Roseateles saccharophilus]